jgi:hypothetical protein
MANSLFPGYVDVEYTSVYGPHAMRLPIRAEPDFDADPTLTQLEMWDLTPRSLFDMVTDLVTALAAYYPATTDFQLYSVWTLATPTSDPVFRQVSRFGVSPISGSGTSVGWDKATQLTHTFRTSGGGVSKLVALDAGSFNAWNKQTDPTGSADLLAVIAEWTSGAAGWAGRDGFQPTTFLQLTKTLNEELRKSYRMT